MTRQEVNDPTDALCIIQKYLTTCLLHPSAHRLLQALSKAKDALMQLHFNRTFAGLWPTHYKPFWFCPSPGLTNKWGHDLGILSWRGPLQRHDFLQKQNSLLKHFSEFLKLSGFLWDLQPLPDSVCKPIPQNTRIGVIFQVWLMILDPYVMLMQVLYCESISKPWPCLLLWQRTLILPRLITGSSGCSRSRESPRRLISSSSQISSISWITFHSA